MLEMPPRSPRVYPVPCWDPQPEDANPAKHHRLQEPACLGSLAQPDLEASARPASKELTSTVVIPTGCAMQLHVEGVDLLLEPEPTSVRRVSLPGHTIILVPEGLQASSQPGQAVFWPAGTQEAPVPDMLQDHHVFALDQGFNGAERYAPCSIWSLKAARAGVCPARNCSLSLHLLLQVIKNKPLRVLRSLHGHRARPRGASSRKGTTTAPQQTVPRTFILFTAYYGGEKRRTWRRVQTLDLTPRAQKLPRRDRKFSSSSGIHLKTFPATSSARVVPSKNPRRLKHGSQKPRKHWRC